MKLGIISDTHDRLESLGKAIEIFKSEKVEMIVHCGDWISPFTIEYFDNYCQKIGLKVPVKSVIGNNIGDIPRMIERNQALANPIEFSAKITLEFTFDGKRVAVFHGHDNAILDSLIASKLYDIVLTGHTHVKRNERIDGVLVVNPGTTCFAANSKIIPKASVAVYNSQTGEVKFITFH